MTLYQHDRAATFRFEVRGELRASVVSELEGCWATALPTFGPRHVVVDVSGVSSWDEKGIDLLRRMHAAGAGLEGGALARVITGEPEPLPPTPAPSTFLYRLQQWLNPARPCRDRV